MGRTKLEKPANPKPLQKKKKVEKAEKIIPLDNKISIKKIANDKEVVAEFPLIKTEDGRLMMSIPLYRQDGLHYTPGFSLADEFTKSFESQQQILQEYRICSQVSKIGADHIKQPKPSSRNSYCTICKVRFEDYKQHTMLESHLVKMRGSCYNKFIDEMCEKKRIERFFMSSQSTMETTANDEIFQSNKIFIEDDVPKPGVKCYGRDKQALYQLIRQECKQKSNQNLFDVIQLPC